MNRKSSGMEPEGQSEPGTSGDWAWRRSGAALLALDKRVAKPTKRRLAVAFFLEVSPWG